MDYRAAVIGCGRIGCAFDDDPRRGYVSTHAGAYLRTPGVQLVALADLDATRLARYGDKFEVAERYRDYREMLSRERPEIVSICTWNETHREIAEAAIANGARAIFCEKPLAENLASADAMIEACKSARVLLAVDHQRRFDRFHQEVATFLRSGGLGAVHQVTSYYTAGVANTGTHLFDLLRLLFGEVEWVIGMYSGASSPNPDDPNIDGWLRFRDGPLVAIQSMDARDYSIFETNILGSRGRLRLMAHGFEAQYETVADSPRFAGYRELLTANVPLEQSSGREFMLQAVAHIVDCLRHGMQPSSSGHDGRRALEVICALHESAEAGGTRVMMPLQDSRITIHSR